MGDNSICKSNHFNLNNKLLLFFVTVIVCNITIFGQDNELLRKIYAINETVIDPNKQVGNLNPDSIPTLPIGLVKEIGGRKYIIAIDSAEFTSEGAFFNAYMVLELPDSDQKIAFAANRIKFNPKGVLGGSQAKLQLVSDHYISIGPNTELFLPGNTGTNYIEWGCNGFESVNLNGFFKFSNKIIVPNNNSLDSLVTAEFQANITDVQNILAEVNFSPFQIRGKSGFVFNINEAYVDLSDYINPPSLVVPEGYSDANSPSWRGFYLKSFTVELPSELRKKGNPTVIYSKDMIIDDAGVTGKFGAKNIYTTQENDINGWGFSIKQLEIQITSNKLTGGSLIGGVEIPALDKTTLKYEALITSEQNSEEVNYNFSIQPSSDVTMNCFKSKLKLFPSSCINVEKNNGKFKPSLILNGQLSLNDPIFKLEKVGFEQLTLVTDAPYITNGIFALNSSNNSNNSLSNFPLSISNIELGVVQNKVVLGADVGLNLSGQQNSSGDANSFSCNTNIKVFSKTTESNLSNKIDFTHDKLTVSTIQLAVNTNAFQLNGLIDLKQDDPQYGNGFYGQLALSIPSVMDNSMNLKCAFGKVNDYKYFFVDGAIPVNINCGQITLTSLIGGISNHMIGQNTTNQTIANIANGSSALDGNSQVYIPSPNSGLSFKAGVGVKYSAKEEAFNGDLLFSIDFNSNGGLSNVALVGDAYMMVKRSERETSNKYVKGTVHIQYDNVEKILDAQANCFAHFSGSITGNLWSQIYISQTEWFIKMGTPSSPAYLNVANLASVNAYLMMGQNLPPMPPPPAQVQQIFYGANLGSQRDNSAIVLGDGIATGMNFNVAFDKRIGFGKNNKYSIYGMGSAGAGFDMTLFNYSPTTRCSGSSERVGLNGWYLQGQLYAYFMLNMGVTGRLAGNNFDINLINGNAALILQGKLPKPTFITGEVALNAKVLGVINVNLNFDFEFGNDCIITQG